MCVAAPAVDRGAWAGGHVVSGLERFVRRVDSAHGGASGARGREDQASAGCGGCLLFLPVRFSLLVFLHDGGGEVCREGV